MAWFHVPTALYGAAIEFFGWTCPLTPLEIRLRARAGENGYGGGFIDEYLRGIVYPEAWADIHVWLGVAVLVGNGLIYWWVWRQARAPADDGPPGRNGGDREGVESDGTARTEGTPSR